MRYLYKVILSGPLLSVKDNNYWLMGKITQVLPKHRWDNNNFFKKSLLRVFPQERHGPPAPKDLLSSSPPLNQEEFHPCSMDLLQHNETHLRETLNPRSVMGCSQIRTLGPCQLPVVELEFF